MERRRRDQHGRENLQLRDDLRHNGAIGVREQPDRSITDGLAGSPWHAPCDPTQFG